MYIALLVWVAVATLLSYVIELLWSDVTSRRVFRIAMAPGVVVRETSRLAACLLTGAKVSRVRLFAKSGPAVKHGKPKLPLLGQAAISLAPVLGCTLALYGVWRLFSSRLGLEAGVLPQIDFSLAGGAALWHALHELFRDSLSRLAGRSLVSVDGFAFIYLVLTFSICMAPEFDELRYALPGLVIIGAAVFALERTGIADFQFAREWSARAASFSWKAFTFSVLLLMSALVMSFPALLLRRLIGKAK
ncbi:MAG TPA: hypothetical protein VM223_14155 [Planctomycetota bacterium]|nr:hypothetical protein [Planctomycetota bacterium]